MAKEFVYDKIKEVGKLAENVAIEVAHYTVDGKVMPDKVYMVTHFKRKNGDNSIKANAICSVTDAKELGKILMEV